MVENGANVSAKNKILAVPMGYAASTTPETVKYLIDKGADINSRNTIGQTPLSYAIMSNKPEIVKILKEAGATE